MKPQSENFKELARKNLANEGQRKILNQFSLILKALRDASFATLPDEKAALEKGRRIREDAIKNLPYLLEMFEKNATKAGAKVVWASDARQANDFIVSLAKEKGANLCVKAKSMISEEILLREEFIENNIETYETDLGEFIVQQAGKTPFHIVGPAINMTIKEVSDLFNKVIGLPETEDPTELAKGARMFLRDKFKDAQIGISGANMVVAETGSIILVENEGNIRFATSAPKTHVVLMSIEKVVPAISDATYMLKLLTRSCTGQRISNYVSVITGPKKVGEIDGPEELYIVILDNGRTKIYADKVLRGALQCIKCGMCAAVCPVYTHVGGYTYGWVYSGPIGAVLNPLLLGLDKARDLYHATTLCGACKDYCPAGVDVRNIVLDLRAKEMNGDRSLDAEAPPASVRIFYRIWTWVLLDYSRYKIASKIMRIVMPFVIKYGKALNLSDRLIQWTRCRDIPQVAPKSFHETYSELKK
ncbi:MAG: lactate utilization protein B [Thermodesulfobacteriota bacterium]|nr:lactate utilization protein B [Thermodesulfobacteriota bacterium]